MMKKGFTALQNGSWEVYEEIFRKKMKASERVFDRIKEAFELVAGRDTKDEHCARDHAQKHRLLAAYHRASWRTGRSHNILPVPKLQQFPSGRLHVVGLWVKDHTVVVQFVENGTTGGNQTGFFLVVQTGESVEQAKVFEAHAVPQGLCANLINAMKLLANQQEEGNGLRQDIVTNLGKGSRKGLTDGLRDVIRVDNERALDVGAPRRGTGTFKVRKPKVPEGGSDVIARESTDELT